MYSRRKIIVAIVILCGSVAVMNAQPRAIGGRIGGNVEFSYQHQLGKNMIDGTLGLGIAPSYTYLNATAMYDWIFPISSWKEKGEWNFYAGLGGGLGFVFRENVDVPFCLNFGGQVGIEYQFWFPLNLSLDYRPMINVLGFGDDIWWGSFFSLALGVRYRF